MKNKRQFKKGHAKKKAPRSRKAYKKSIIQPKKIVKSQALITIPYTEIEKPEMYRGKLSVIPTPFTENQIERLVAHTPPEIVLQRKGKAGQMWSYIPGWYFKKKLNFIFGWLWSFDILSERIDGDYITVKGKLIINDKNGNQRVAKTDFGGAQIKYLRNSKEYLDISNDFKAAATDCLKRCAVQLGIGLDVYSKSEYKTENGNLEPVEAKSTQTPVKSMQVQPVQTDYIVKLNKFLDEHPKGPFTANEKMRFVYQQTKQQVDWTKLTQQQAQVIFAILIRNQK